MSSSTIIPIIFIIITLIALGIFKLLKICPANKILVIHDKFHGDRPAICKQGGLHIVFPILQDYSFLSLTPFTLNIDLPKALTKMNIRVNITANFTCVISTEPEVMQNAAEHLFNKQQYNINNLATEIISGQMRQIIATMDIEKFDTQRDEFLSLVKIDVETELKKIGLKLINANIIDIRDECGYLDALDKERIAIAKYNTLKNARELDRDYNINSKKIQTIQLLQDKIQLLQNNSEIIPSKKIQTIQLLQDEIQLLQNNSEIIPPGSNTDKSDSTMDTNGLTAEILDNSVLLIKSNHSPIAKISLFNQIESNTIGSSGSDINTRSIDLLSSNSLVIQRNLKDIMRIDFESEQNS